MIGITTAWETVLKDYTGGKDLKRGRAPHCSVRKA